MKRMSKAGVSGCLLVYVIFCFVSLAAVPLFANDESSSAQSSSDAQSSAGSGVSGESTTDTFGKITEKILEQKKSRPDEQVNQMARDLQQIEDEQKTLAAASATAEKGGDSFSDPELLLKSKVSLAARKRSLIVRKAAFYQERLRTQSTSHAKIQFFLTHVFSDDASLFVVTEQLKDLSRKKAARLSQKEALTREIHAVSSRIQIEEQYLGAKKLLLAAARDDEKARIQETVTLAEDRLKVFQDTKAFLGEQLDFAEFRIGTIQEFDKLIRLRRRDLLKEEIFSKRTVPYGKTEVIASFLALLCLAGGFLFRKRFDAAVRSLPSVLNQEGILACARVLWFFGSLSLFCWGVFDLLGYRVAAVALGFIYLNVALGLVLYVSIKGLVVSLSMSVLQKLAKATQTEIKQSSSVFLLVRTVLMWLIFGAIFYQILAYWALEQEVIQWLIGIANQPIFQAEKIRISIWVLVRSVLVFWLFYVGARFLNGILKARVYPKSSLDKNSQYAIKSVIQFSFLVIGAMAGIQLLGVDLGALAVFSGALGVGIGFGLQDIIKNVFSGFVIFFERPIRMGDVVEVGGVPGQDPALLGP